MVDFTLPPEGVQFKEQPDMVMNEGIVFNPQPTGVEYGEDIAATRAQKYTYGLGVDFDQTLADLKSGKELNLQQKSAMIAKLRMDSAHAALVSSQGVWITPDTKAPDPNTSMEEEFAGRMTSAIPSFFAASGLAKLATDPDAFDQSLVDAHGAYSSKEVLSSVYQKWAPKIEERTIGPGRWSNAITSSDTAELLVPGLSWWRLGDVAKRNAINGYTTATNIEELVGSVIRKPLSEQPAAADKIVGELFDKNAYDAAQFLSALDSYSTADRFFDHFGDALNLPGLSTWKWTLSKASQFIRPSYVKMSGVMEAAGDIPAASRAKVVENIKDFANATDEGAQLKAQLKNAYSAADPDSFLVPTANFSKRAAERVQRSLAANEVEFNKILTETLSIKRLDEDSPALGVALAEADKAVRDRLKHWSSSIMDVRYINSDEGIGNVAKVEARVGTPEKAFNAKINIKSKETGQLLTTMETTIGKIDSTFFDSLKQAETHAKDYYGFKPNTYTIREEAPDKFYISVMQDVAENTPKVQQALIDTVRGKDPTDWRSLVLQRLGSAEVLNDKVMSDMRKTTVFGTSQVLDQMAKLIQDNIVSPLKGDSKTKFNSFINSQRDFEAAGGEINGKFSKNQPEFERDWYAHHKVFPTEQESQAYWGYVQMSDFDWTVRNVNRYTQMAQAGWMQIGFNTKAYKMKQPLIEGKIIQQIPEYKDWPARFMEWSEGSTPSRINGRQAQDLLDQGYKLVQLHPEGKAKLDFIKKQIGGPEGSFDYVLVRNPTEAPLDWRRVAYNPGGHRVHQDDWFASFAKITTNESDDVQRRISRYLGDFNLSSHMIRSQAQIIVDRMNIAKELWRNNETAKLSQYIQDHLPSSLSERRVLEIFQDPQFPRAANFELRRKDKSLWDSKDLRARYDNLLRESENPHHLGTALEDTSYVGHREPRLPSYDFEGAAHVPSARIGQSRLLDALPALGQTLGQNLRNLFMDDMKIKHATDFMARYGDLLDTPSATDALLDPLKHTLQTGFKEGGDVNRLRAAKAYRESIKNFTGLDSPQQLDVLTFRERTLEAIYNRFGYDAAEQAASYLTPSLDPIKFLRQAAFHSKIGLFHIPAFITQAMQYSTMAGIAGPQAAADALAWAQYARMMRKASPEVQEALASKVGQWGGNANDFKDYYDGLKRSGLLTVGKESVFLDDDKAFRVARSGLQTVLDWGKYPFEAGEKLSRIAAFQIAFREWRNTVGPSIKLNDDALRSVIGRTDLLLSSMTHASTASWQQGWASVPVQFFNWHMRMTEQMLGSKLTPKEKLSLALTNGVLYGAPAMIATAPLTAVLPVHQIVEGVYNIRGGSVETSPIINTFLNGAVGALLKATTGDQFNPQERFGPGKNPIMDHLFGDKQSFVVTVAGAGGSTIQDMARLAIPVVANIGARIQGNELPLQFGDFKEEVGKIVNSLGAIEKLLAATNTGQYISKNNKLLAETDDFKGWMTYLTGLQPRALTTASDKTTQINVIKGFQKTMEPTMLRYHNEMYKAGQADDMDTMREYEKRLTTLYNLTNMTVKDRSDFEFRAFQNMDKTWVERTDKNLAKRGPSQVNRLILEQREKANGGR